MRRPCVVAGAGVLRARRPEQRAHGGTGQGHEARHQHGRVQPRHEGGVAPRRDGVGQLAARTFGNRGQSLRHDGAFVEPTAASAHGARRALVRAGFSAAVTDAARIEPHTAVPRTPPSWMEVVWIPPATPASSSEMSPTMASVADVTTSPMPRPNRTNGGQRWMYEESTWRVTKEKMATEEASRPKVMGSQGPNRLTSRAPERSREGEGDRERQETQAGADRAESVHALQVERNEEQHAEEREEVQQHDDGADRDGAHAKDGQRHERVAARDARRRRRRRAGRVPPQ